MSTRTKKTSTVGLRTLRENIEEYVTRVNNGESITVLRKNTPLFKLTPVDEDAQWETVIDFTKEFGKGVPTHKILASIKKLHG